MFLTDRARRRALAAAAGLAGTAAALPLALTPTAQATSAARPAAAAVAASAPAGDTYRPGPAARHLKAAAVAAAAPRAATTAAGTTAAAAAAVVPIPEGAFIRDATDGKIYRVVGGAPLYVSSWTPFGGPKPLTAFTQAQADLLRFWPKDGTFVTSLQTKQVWRFVAGSPMLVSAWSALGLAPQKTIGIDVNDILNAGKAAPWDAVRATVADAEFNGERTFVVGGTTHRAYVLAGGSPQRVYTWATYGGVQPFTVIDEKLIDNLAFLTAPTSPFRYIRPVPFARWKFLTPEDPRLYVIAGAAPIYTSTTKIFDPNFAPAAASVVPKRDLDEAKTGLNKHLGYTPLDGAVLKATDAAGTKIYTTTAGVPNETPTADQTQVVVVDPAAIANRGKPYPWDHLLAPAV